MYRYKKHVNRKALRMHCGDKGPDRERCGLLDSPDTCFETCVDTSIILLEPLRALVLIRAGKVRQHRRNDRDSSCMIQREPNAPVRPQIIESVTLTGHVADYLVGTVPKYSNLPAPYSTSMYLSVFVYRTRTVVG